MADAPTPEPSPYYSDDHVTIYHGDCLAKPGFAIEDRGLPDVWQHKVGSYKESGHPAEKPEGLVRRLITTSGDAGVVLDPFLGSGTTAVAAKNAGWKAIGIEAEERYCEIAAQRCAQEVLAL